METRQGCPLYRESENLGMEQGIGYCDLDCDRATCGGSLQFCEKPDILRKCQLDQKRGRSFEWRKRRGDVRSTESQRA